MTTNKSKGSKPRKSVQIIRGKTDAETRKNAAATICGSDLAAYRVISAADGQGCFGDVLDVPILMKHLRDQAGDVQAGNLSQAEAMLTNQATALQSLFARLVEIGMGQSMRANVEMYMKLALRSQNQCRATLETLATIKNPPMVFAKQANIANGPQQVNNGIGVPRAQENKNEQTQLLEGTPNEERLDFGETAAASGTHKDLATVGEVNRATNRGGQTGQRQARL